MRYLISTIRNTCVWVENLIPNNALECMAFFDHPPAAVAKFEELKRQQGG
jgi:hypothetical protein